MELNHKAQTIKSRNFKNPFGLEFSNPVQPSLFYDILFYLLLLRLGNGVERGQVN